MKIAMATEYFWPYDIGGSEWSTYYLAKELVNKGFEVIVITPNYGTKEVEIFENIKIIRFPFYKKIKDNKQISPYWHTGFPWFLFSTFYLIKICRKESIDIIHVQGKYYSPAGFLAKLILKITVILTIRDYQLICGYGFCVWQKTKACGIFEYFRRDFPFYVKNYLRNPSYGSIILNFLFAINSRLTKYFYAFFAKRLDLLICISKAQSEIYIKNGFKKVKVVYNPMQFSQTQFTSKPKKQILFAGRLTPGKGSILLFEALPRVFKKLKVLKVLIAGEGFLKNDLKTIAHKSSFAKNIEFLGRLDHDRLLKIYSQSLITVVPSLWPEPFGRVALESISQGTPVVVTNRGGLKEIIGNFNIGIISKANSYNLSKAIIKAIDSNFELRSNIRNQYQKIREKFQKDVTQKYLYSYKK